MTHPFRIAALVCLLIASAVGENTAWGAAPDKAGFIGRQVADFSLPDVHGQKHAMADLAEKPIVVIAVLGTECPLAKLYAPRLQEIADLYADRGVAVLGINANSQDSLSEMAAQARAAGLKFPQLKDLEGQVIDRLGAERTPEVFVLDDQRKIRYRGAIDDQYIVGHMRDAPQRRHLRFAIDELLAGEPVSVPVTDATGCLIGRRPRREPTGEVTYAKHIARILENHCVECHRPWQTAPFALNNYEAAKGWAAMMLEVVDQGRMPPWSADTKPGDFLNDRRLSADERDLLEIWVENGCPEGDERDLPPPGNWADGWRIEKPDAVFYMSEEPFRVPAEGTLKYQYFTVDPKFTEDKWISAIEARPGNPAVVHHILVEFMGREAEKEHDFLARPQVGYAPGLPPYRFPEGTAIHVPAGSQMVFQMHYTPNGTPQEDRSYIGLKFVDPSTVRRNVHCLRVGNAKFEIPPGDPNYVVTADKKLHDPLRIASFTPHMHFRGKSFRYEAEYPDGRREMLFNVPRYDFHWQLRYELREPIELPAGTVLHCTGVFDNSADNPLNPDPSATVRWGDQTWEEMMLGYMMVLSVDEDGPAGRRGETLAPESTSSSAQ